MKNLRNLLATISLLAVMVISATSVNAGIMMSDRSNPSDGSCGDSSDIKFDISILDSIAGIIVAGRTGIIVAGRDGIIVAGKEGSNPGDRCGIMMSDRTGIMMSD